MSKSNFTQYVVSPQYMEKFQCVGSACEDHCCQGWRIVIERETFKKVQNAFKRDKLDREKFERSFKRMRTSKNKNAEFAYIALNQSDGQCPYLDSSSLCEIHRRFGQAYLSRTCRIYPRRIRVFGNSIEMSASFSCPEVARLCLLDAESCMLIQKTADPADEYISTSSDTECFSDPYHTYKNEIRNIINEFLSARQYPIASRLFFIAYFSNRIGSFFYKGSAVFKEERLISELDRIIDQSMIPELHNQFCSMKASIELPMNIVQTVLAAKTINPSLSQLILKAWSKYDVIDEVGQLRMIQSSDGILDSRQMFEIYTARRSQLHERFSVQLNLFFENYFKNSWFGELYTESSDLLSHMQILLVRVAIFSFIFYSNPGLDEILKGGDSETEQKILNQVAVEVFYKFSRAIEHDTVLAKSIFSALEEQEMLSLAHIVQFLKFI